MPLGAISQQVLLLTFLMMSLTLRMILPTAKSVCSKLLMGTVKRDISAVEASFELSVLPLYRSSHTFQSISMSGFRVLENNGSKGTRNTPLDKYLERKKVILLLFTNSYVKQAKSLSLMVVEFRLVGL